jgi:hypothetical protein
LRKGIEETEDGIFQNFCEVEQGNRAALGERYRIESTLSSHHDAEY